MVDEEVTKPEAPFYELRDDLGFPGRWHLESPELDGGDVYDTYAQGASQPHRSDLTVAIAQPGLPLDFTIAGTDTPVASARLANILGTIAEHDIQVLPIRIVRHPGFYCVLNALRTVDCFDESRSEYTKWTTSDHRADKAGHYRMVTRLRIDPSRARDAHIFRISRWVMPLIVSSAVRAAIVEGGFSGAHFEPVS